MAALTLNEIYYDKYIKNDFYLNSISYDEAGLFIMQNNEVVKKVYFYKHDDLAKLPVIAFKINDPYYFLDVLKTNIDCEINYQINSDDNEADLSNTTMIDRMYLPIRFILIKNESTIEDDHTVMDFINTYNNLVNANGYLTEKSSRLFNEMSSVLNWSLAAENNKPKNNAQIIVRQYINALNNGYNNEFVNNNINGGNKMSNGVSLERTNPNNPSIISDEVKEKAGFFSFFALLYIALNLLITLVLLAIKK